MSPEVLFPKIYTVRNEPVMLDSELALLYGVETGQFNRAMKRNATRFPEDFVFQLTRDEWNSLRACLENPVVLFCGGVVPLALLRLSYRFPRNMHLRRVAPVWPPRSQTRPTLFSKHALRCQIGTLKEAGRGRHRKYLPKVFTEHGAIMAATILNSSRAAAMSVYIVRAFVRIRRELLANATLEKRLANIEKTLIAHDGALRDVYEKIRPLLLPPPETPKRRIGFRTEPE